MSVPGRRPLAAVLLGLGLVVTAFAVWIVGIVGFGQFGEDICITDPPSEAAGYQTGASVFPPRMTCIYDTVDDERLEVDHPIYAYAAAAWLVGFPVAAVVGVSAIMLVVLRRPHPRGPASSSTDVG